MNRQKQILFILLLVLGLSLVYAWFANPRQQEIVSDVRNQSPAPAGRDRDGQTSAVAAADPVQVDLALLDREKEKYNGYKRDIFNFYVPKPVAPPPPKPVVQAPSPPPPPVPVVTPQVRVQLAQFTFLGFLVKNGERTVFLSKKDELFLVRNGDTFGEENRFEVVDINEEKLTIRQRGAADLIEIPLVEKEPLIPSFSPGEPGGQVLASPPLKMTPGLAIPRTQPPPQEQRRRWFKGAQTPEQPVPLPETEE